MSRKGRARSERRPDASSKAAKGGAGAAATGSRPQIGSIAVLTALALVVSAVFFVQLVRPDGFLAALTQADVSRLSRNEEAGLAPNWQTLFATLREELRRAPTTRGLEAVSKLLGLVVRVERGKADAASASAEARLALAQDPENLLSRMACAVIVNPPVMGSEPGDPLEQFRAMEQVVSRPGPATRVRLYNKEVDAVWFEILRKEISRQDVASNVAKYIRHFEIREQYAALPMIQRRLSALAEELDAAGHHDEARGVRRWLVQLFVGLMRSEPDSGTGLLCADLLGRTLAGSEPELAARMAALRGAYHAAADAAPVDLTDPARSPAVMPGRYRSMMDSMVFALFLALAGLGAASVLLLSAMSGMFRIFWRMVYRGPVASESETPSVVMQSIPIRMAIAVACIGGLVGMLEVFWPLENAAFFSEAWGYHALILAFAMGAMLVLVRGAFATKDAAASNGVLSSRRTQVFIAVVLAVVPIVLTVMPPPWLEWPMRWLDRGVPSIIVLIVLMLILVGVAYRIVRVPARVTAATAATTWLICLVVGVLFMLNHGLHDWIVISPNPSFRTDEVRSRLRIDWEAQFLTDIAKAYDIPSS